MKEGRKNKYDIFIKLFNEDDIEDEKLEDDIEEEIE